MGFEKSKTTILIVDDTPENIAILGEYLSEYKIKVALNGQQAINLIETGLIPDIILLDIMMPGIDGYEVCTRIKNTDIVKDVPIVFISAITEASDKVKGFKAGAVDYITKPFQLQEVKSRIETHLSLSFYKRELENINTVLEQKVIERTYELMISKEKAEEASRLKSHFLSLMSHELRTPMVGIIGYSEVLMDELTDPEYKQYAANLNESALRLKDTLESILILSKLESQTQTVHPVLFNITSRAIELSKNFHRQASQKGVELIVINHSKAADVVLDKTMFDIIVNNLLSNAVKYTDKGTVTIELFDEILNGEKFYCLKVSDTGIGIPKDKQEMIFEEFRQVNEGMSRNFEGVGLGLSLVKNYVERLNGFISLESEEGKGSEFTVKLKPWDKLEFMDKPEVKEVVEKIRPRIHDVNKPRVLIVEDDRINVEVTKLFLSELADVDVAMDGSSAIQLAQKNNYDAVLMDINLGKGLTGIEVTKVLRQYDKYKDTPVIAFTAFAMDGDEKSFIEEGCSHYMPKPYSKKDFIDFVKKII